jgi:branched-chain amino acid aminotransferase
MPIDSVDETVLGGTPGPGELTTQLHNLYWKKRWQGWRGTKVDYTQYSPA